MSRYTQHSGSGTGSTNSNDYDDTTLKLQKYAALRVTGKRVNFADTQYGDRFIVGFDGVSVLDGVVFQRKDAPGTWKVFGFGHLGFEVSNDGRVYEQYDASSEEFTNELSAQGILENPRVQGFSEGPFGGKMYHYVPVGVVIEGAADTAMNDDIGAETTDSGAIDVGEVSMILSNKSWVRKLAKLTTDVGESLIAMTTDEDGNEVAVTDERDWLTTEEFDLREGLEGREMELFIIEESHTFDGDDEPTKWTTPILLDSKTGERITLDNDEADGESESESEAPAEEEEDEQEAEPIAADGGTAAQQPADADVTDASGVDVPDVLDDLIDYFARTQGEVEPDELREFAADEVDDADAVDWEAAAAEVGQRA